MKHRKIARRKKTAGAASAVKSAVVKCAFCKGTGKDPFKLLSPLSNCPACNGSGTNTVNTPYEKCKACGGTGLYYRSKLYCWPCRGKGVVPKGSQ